MVNLKKNPTLQSVPFVAVEQVEKPFGHLTQTLSINEYPSEQPS